MQWIARASRAHVIVALTGLVAFLATFSYLQSLDKKIAVAQLNRDIHAGELITRRDVTFVSIAHDDLLTNTIVTPKKLEPNGIVARVDLSRSDFLTTSNTARKATKQGKQSLSIAVETSNANGGDITAHDVIDVWKTGDEAALIAENIEVRKVILPNKRLGIATSQTVTLVLAVTREQADNLSRVIGKNDIMIVLSTGESQSHEHSTDSSPAHNEEFEPVTLNKETE